MARKQQCADLPQIRHRYATAPWGAILMSKKWRKAPPAASCEISAVPNILPVHSTPTPPLVLGTFCCEWRNIPRKKGDWCDGGS